MAYYVAPPPSVTELVSYLAKWLALNMRAKITVTVKQHNGEYYTEEYDGRLLPKVKP